MSQVHLGRVQQEIRENQTVTETLTGGRFRSWQWIAFLVTGIVVSVISAVMVWNHERNELVDRFAQSTKEVAIALQEAINNDLEVLQELKTFYGALEEVNETEFQNFAQSSMSQHPSLYGVGWIPSLSHTEQPKGLPLKRDRPDDPQPQTSPTSAPESKESLPITYVASKKYLELNVGFDLAWETNLVNIQEAKDTGKTVLLTQLDSLMGADKLLSNHTGEFWAISAIYQKLFNYSTIQSRRQNLQGFIVGIFNLADIVESLKQRQNFDRLEVIQTTNLVIFQSDQAQHFDRYQNFSSRRPIDNIFAIYEGATGIWTKNFSPSQNLDMVEFLCQEPNSCIQELQIGNQLWLVEFLPTSAYLDTQPTSKMWLTLLLGLSATGILSASFPWFFSLYRHSRANRELLSQAYQEISELKQQNADLEILLETTTEHSATIENQLQTFLQQKSEGYEELQQANIELIQINSEIMLLGKMSNLLQACFTEEEAHATIAEFMQRRFPNQSGAIYRIHNSKNLVESVVSWGKNVPKERVFNPHDCWSLRSGRSHLFDADHSGLPCKHYHHLSTEQSICIPLITQGETFGLLHLSADRPQYKLTEAEQKLAMTVAEHTGLALANLKLRETLRFQSIRDPLTGLYNRRYLEEYLQQEVYRSQRYEKPFGVMMIDVDHFKRFNDTFGHEAGDMVLQELGKFLKQNVRGSDVACRYGGEEFTLILSEACLEKSNNIAEKIRQGVKQLNVKFRHQSLDGITISVGVAVFPQNGLSSEQLLESADRALYRAKKEGRDRVILASDPVTIAPILKLLP